MATVTLVQERPQTSVDILEQAQRVAEEAKRAASRAQKAPEHQAVVHIRPETYG